MSKRKWASQSTRSMRQNHNDIFLSQPGLSSQDNVSSQCNSQNTALENMEEQEEMQLISRVIRYLFVMDRNKHVIQKHQIIKNALDGKSKVFRSVMEKADKQLSKIFGYKLVQVDSGKYILVNEIENHIPHLSFTKNVNSQVLLFLVLVHIFMLGDSCKEEMIWDFLRNLGIVTQDNFQHDYFGDVKYLITNEFITQRYLEKSIIDKNDPSQFEYKWGSRAQNEVTYRSALEFISNIYGRSLNNWKLQYKAMLAQERKEK